jgi:hypothetical protein
VRKINAIMIISLISVNVMAQDISGEHLIISEKIYPLKNYSGKPGEIMIDGEIAAFANGKEIARAKITDNEFHLRLDEIPPDILNHWEMDYDSDVIQCSDPETKTARLDLRITGTKLDIERAIILLSDTEPSLRQYSLEEKRPGMENGYHYEERFSYVYSDRDTFLIGENSDEIYNISLKKGWNKIRHYKEGYYAGISESTVEKGIFEIYYFDLNDYINNDDTRQPATLEGRVIVQRNRNLPIERYFLLKEPIRVRDSYGAERDVHRLLLLIDERIHKTFPINGNYILHGDIEYFVTPDGDIMFYVLKLKKKRW